MGIFGWMSEESQTPRFLCTFWVGETALLTPCRGQQPPTVRRSLQVPCPLQGLPMPPLTSSKPVSGSDHSWSQSKWENSFCSGRSVFFLPRITRPGNMDQQCLEDRSWEILRMLDQYARSGEIQQVQEGVCLKFKAFPGQPLLFLCTVTTETGKL